MPGPVCGTGANDLDREALLAMEVQQVFLAVVLAPAVFGLRQRIAGLIHERADSGGRDAAVIQEHLHLAAGEFGQVPGPLVVDTIEFVEESRPGVEPFQGAYARREVVDFVDPLHDLRQAGLVQQVPEDDLDPEVPHEPEMTAARLIQHADLAAGLRQSLGQVRANEPCAAGHQRDAHAVLPLGTSLYYSIF
ncbi:MAG: hypothetical protein A2506_01905 [Elusimicrobia bacterium RIFOXYD12_FULL_66_9]|nr:MAG: hypothetical protein A2506_01905 [Elusimicrobia bacterium RIFOXYD12_FULL_66_9]